jgi:hypothetical protein
VPQCDGASTSPVYLPEWLNSSIPFDESSKLPEKCTKFVAVESLGCSVNDFNRSATTQCDDFVFEDDEITILNEVMNNLAIVLSHTRLESISSLA